MWKTNGRNRANRPARVAKLYCCEGLEPRRLLSTFTWSNRGENPPGQLSDEFDQAFGSNAELARNIVDRAIGDWQRVIEKFNRSDGFDGFYLTFDAKSLAPIAAPYVIGAGFFSDDGKPTDGYITFDNDAVGAGWYFDPVAGSPTLPDDGEFPSLVNRFCAQGGPAPGQIDFYSAAVAAIGLGVGFLGSTFNNYSAGGKAVQTNVPDPNVPGTNLWRYDGPSGTYTFVSDTTGTRYPDRFYGGPAVGGLPTFSDDLMNISINAGQRRLISDADALFLRDRWGFTVNLPLQINTFYANYNGSTSTLNVTGDGGFSTNTMSISCGGATDVMVNGTHETISGAISTLNVIGGSGADDITLTGLLPHQATIDTGISDDIVNIVDFQPPRHPTPRSRGDSGVMRARISLAHSEDEIEATIKGAQNTFETIARSAIAGGLPRATYVAHRLRRSEMGVAKPSI